MVAASAVLGYAVTRLSRTISGTDGNPTRCLDPQGAIDINGKRYLLGRRLVGRYVTATIFTHRRMLVVKVGARRYKRFPSPMPEPLVAAIVPLPRGWS